MREMKRRTEMILATCFLVGVSVCTGLDVRPATRLGVSPVLTVREPASGCTVHLVGVSHGSAASAALVKETIINHRPSAVLLELCDDRFLSVSLESQLRPRLNQTQIDAYDSRMSVFKAAALKMNSTLPFVRMSPVEQALSAFRFARGQGLVGGVFVMLGLLIGSFQRIARASSGDEFVTAMREAEALAVPVMLVDASQNDTLQSIQRVISPDFIHPAVVLRDMQSLAFSSLGIGAVSSLRGRVTEGVLTEMTTPARKSPWISIPAVYAQNENLGKSLLPLLVVLLAPSLLDSLQLLPSLTADPSALVASSSEFREQVLNTIEIAVDVLSFLFLVRMSKIIGSERDDIMAANIQEICRRYPRGELVVVIGMLHCNGIARWLMSGQNPFGSVGYVEERER